VAYGWGTARPTNPTFDGQLTVDDKGTTSQWNATDQVWVKKPNYVFREVNRQILLIAGYPIIKDVLIGPASYLGACWDDVYGLSFIEVRNSSTGVTYYNGKQAQVQRSSLSDWLIDIVPHNGVSFLESPELIFYEVIDPSLRPGRTVSWNKLYSCIRGRKSYRSAKRRWATNPYSGVASNFFGYYDTSQDILRRIWAYFQGGAPVWIGDGDIDALWQPRERAGLYNYPTNSGQYTRGHGVYGRKCWDTITEQWILAPSGTWNLTAGTSLPNPAVIYEEVSGGHNNLMVASPTVLRGTRVFSETMKAVLVFQIKMGTYYAWVVKPYGITNYAFDTDLRTADWDLMSETVFARESSRVRRRSVYGVQDRTQLVNYSGGWRFEVYHAISANVSGSHGSRSPLIPKMLRFYLRNKTTGLRSEVFPGTIEVLSRKNNAPILLVEGRT